MFGFGKQRSSENWEDFEAEALPHLPDLYRIARWMVRNTEEAEDLVQETLIQALRSFHRYEKGTNCKAWMTKIMYNLNGKRIARLGRLKLVEDKEEMIAETAAFEPSIPQNLTDEDVIAAVKRLPDSFRTVVLLADVEDLAYREIAEVLSIPAGTVMSRLHRGRKQLRVELAGYARDYGIRNVRDAGV
jgi:RNA polymerase sigma-70 factor (ECF subfamily)